MVGHPLRVRVAVLANRRLFVQRHAVGLELLEHGSESPIHIHAREHQEPDVGWCRSQDGAGVGPAQRAAVDQSIGPERSQVRGSTGELRTLDVQMLDRGKVRRLGCASMHDHNLVVGRREVLNKGAADEPGAPDDDDPHGPSVWAG